MYVLVCVCLGCFLPSSLCKKSPLMLQDIQEEQHEVTLKVHLSDSATHQPLGGVTVELLANHTSVAVETSGSDGNAFLRFPYRLGTALVVTATRQGYVPNSAPWSPIRLPVFSSLSLDLLPERAATLMVYDNVVQILSGFQGSIGQPWVQFPRRALSLPADTSYSNLTALLTVASSPAGVQNFPYFLGLAGNGTENRLELTPVAAISVHLLAGEGAELQVNEPISISVPLLADSGLKENDHIPAWRFDPRLGAWLKSSLGSVHRDGQHLSVTYIAPQLGYWVVAMSPLHPGPVVSKDISLYHTVFLLAILGGMAVILLCLLCLLLYYCRRRCLTPRGSHHKLTMSSGAGLDGRRDQATSMSHLNLLNSEVHLELVSTEADSSTPMLKQSYHHQDNNHHHPSNHLLPTNTHTKQHHSGRSSLATSSRHGSSSLGNLTPGRRPLDYRQSTDTFPCKAPLASVGGGANDHRGYRQSYASVCSSAHQVSDGGGLMGLGGPPNGGPPSSSSPPHSPCRGVTEGLGADGRPSQDFPLSRSVPDHLERGPRGAGGGGGPTPGGPLLCCGSVDLLSGTSPAYARGVRPTLVIPAHYMRLPGEHPLCGQALLLQMDQRSDLETLQAEINASHPQSPGGGSQSPSPCSADTPPSLGGGGGGGGAQGQRGGPDDPMMRGVSSGLSGSLSIPAALGGAGGGMEEEGGPGGGGRGLVEMNSEDTLLAEKTLMALRGGKPLPHPRAWFVSLDGRSNAHIRHSYIDLPRAATGGGGEGGRRRGGGGGGGGAMKGFMMKANNDPASLDSGLDLNEPTGPAVTPRGPGGRREGRGERREREVRDNREESADHGSSFSDKGSKGPAVGPVALGPPVGATYTQLEYVEGGGESESPSPTSSYSPPSQEVEDSSVPQSGKTRKWSESGGGAAPEVEEVEVVVVPSSPSSPSPTSSSSSSSLSPLSSPPPPPRTEHTSAAAITVTVREQQEHGGDLEEEEEEDEEEKKKSAWQRREERPLLSFNAIK